MKVTKAVIPVAGKGTRYLPATKEIPKEMIPILNRPMIHYVVKEAVEAGIEDIIFITSCNKTSIEDYFDRNLELEAFLEKKGKAEALKQIQEIGETANIITIRQKEQLGLGHAIGQAENIIGGEDFAVLLGDEIIVGENPVTKQLIEAYHRVGQKSIVGVMEIGPEQTDRYGVIDGEALEKSPSDFRIRRMVEKPSPEQAPSCLATPGRYVFTNDIFDYLKNLDFGPSGEIQLTDAINNKALKTEVYAHLFTGDRYDTGSIEGFLEATLEFALASPQYSTIMKEILQHKISKYNL